jgi:hypothetical protein
MPISCGCVRMKSDQRAPGISLAQTRQACQDPTGALPKRAWRRRVTPAPVLLDFET